MMFNRRIGPIGIALVLVFTLVRCTTKESNCSLLLEPHLIGNELTCFAFLRHDCPASKAVAHKIVSLDSAYADSGLVFVLFYPDRQADAALCDSTERMLNLPAEVLPDRKLDYAACTGATITPQFVLYDNSGRKVYSGAFDDYYFSLARHRTRVENHYLEDAVRAVLNGDAVPVAETKAIGCIIQ